MGFSASAILPTNLVGSVGNSNEVTAAKSTFTVNSDVYYTHAKVPLYKLTLEKETHEQTFTKAVEDLPSTCKDAFGKFINGGAEPSALTHLSANLAPTTSPGSSWAGLSASQARTASRSAPS